MDIPAKISEKLAEKLVDGACAAISWVASEYSRIQGVESEIEKLSKRRKRIEDSLNDSVQRRRIENAATRGMLQELKSLASEMEDLADKFHTQLNISRSAANSRKRKYGAALTTNRQFANKIADVKERYDNIFSDRRDLLLTETEAIRLTARELPTIAHGTDDGAQIVGRADEMDKIVKFLTSDTRGLPVFSILGCGGVGKTALARSVFEDDDDVNRYFSLKIWATLGEGFDVAKATREIARSIEKKEECPLGISSLNLLQLHLRKLVQGNRFLIVLDSVCNEELFFWEELSSPLRGGVEGSKVLIATHSRIVSRNMQVPTERQLQLGALARVHSKQLLKARAFPRGDEELFPQDLADVADELLNKCQDMPLAVKSIGGTLFNERDVRKWRRVLDEMPESDAVAQTVTPLLKVSYDRLPLNLKNCLVFCSVFPAGHEFDKDELVRLWMALGLVKPKSERRFTPLERIGDDYFEGLKWRSFFQASDGGSDGHQKYKIPSMVHVLAQSVSEGDCLWTDHAGIQCGEVKRARYALVHQQGDQPVPLNKLFENESPSLRALILHGEKAVIKKHELISLFKKLTHVRVLDLSCSLLDQLPNSIGDLILLRHVNLRRTNISTLPESVGNLYNLQTLELGGCRQLATLPNSIGDLKHLRYLGLDNGFEGLPETLANPDVINWHTPDTSIAPVKLESPCYLMKMVAAIPGIQRLLGIEYLNRSRTEEDSQRSTSLQEQSTSHEDES